MQGGAVQPHMLTELAFQGHFSLSGVTGPSLLTSGHLLTPELVWVLASGVPWAGPFSCRAPPGGLAWGPLQLRLEGGLEAEPRDL